VKYVVIVTSEDGTQGVVGPFLSAQAANLYALGLEGLEAQATPLESPVFEWELS
jgi:hypothetical protein